jgi:hypothetical protein
MRIAALGLLVGLGLVGCEGGRDYPITTGGDDHPINPMADGRPADGIVGDGAMSVGRVCVISDLRTPAAGCRITGAANITVKLGTATTLTADDGSFMIVAPSGSGLAWRTSGTNLVPSVIPLTTSNVLPMISDIDYLALQNSNSVIINSGQGSAVLYVSRADMPVPGATTAVSPQLPPFGSLGDRANATNWVLGETGPKGVSWTPGLTAGPTTLTVTPPVGDAAMITVPIEDGAITFATLVIP